LVLQHLTIQTTLAAATVLAVVAVVVVTKEVLVVETKQTQDATLEPIQEIMVQTWFLLIG
jgi:signal transduction histidine kinase